MKINSNTIVLKNGSEEYKELESILTKVAAENKIDNVNSIHISLDKESGVVKFSWEMEPTPGSELHFTPAGRMTSKQDISEKLSPEEIAEKKELDESEEESIKKKPLHLK